MISKHKINEKALFDFMTKEGETVECDDCIEEGYFEDSYEAEFAYKRKEEDSVKFYCLHHLRSMFTKGYEEIFSLKVCEIKRLVNETRDFGILAKNRLEPLCVRAVNTSDVCEKRLIIIEEKINLLHELFIQQD